MVGSSLPFQYFLHIIRIFSYHYTLRRHLKLSPSLIPPFTRDGNDGPWSSFNISIGTPPQTVRLLISTSTTQSLAILPDACTTPNSSDSYDCVSQRGGLFDPDKSVTWVDQGNHTLELERNLGYNDNGDFGFDNIILGPPGSASIQLSNQSVVGVASEDFYIGVLGLRPTFANSGANPDYSITSLMTTLKSKNLIPSLSWSYTAGAYHESFCKNISFPNFYRLLMMV